MRFFLVDVVGGSSDRPYRVFVEGCDRAWVRWQNTLLRLKEQGVTVKIEETDPFPLAKAYSISEFEAAL